MAAATEIPKRTRAIKAATAFAITVAVTAYVLVNAYIKDQISLITLCILPFFVVGSLIAYKYWRTTHIEEKVEQATKIKSNTTSEAERVVVILVSLALMISAPCILSWQCWQYLKFGQWHSLSIITLLSHLDIAWANNPTSWFGLHKILNFFPLSLAALVSGILLPLLE